MIVGRTSGPPMIVEADLQVRPRTRKWRNWQTHQLEGLAVAIPWGFESPLPHQLYVVKKEDGWRWADRQYRAQRLVSLSRRCATLCLADVQDERSSTERPARPGASRVLHSFQSSP